MDDGNFTIHYLRLLTLARARIRDAFDGNFQPTALFYNDSRHRAREFNPYGSEHVRGH
jgi:hypothetical protein